MSNIAMCDNCGTIFSLNEEGWETYMRQQKVSHPASNMPIVQREWHMHLCKECARGDGESAVRPRLGAAKSLERADNENDTHAGGMTRAEWNRLYPDFDDSGKGRD